MRTDTTPKQPYEGPVAFRIYPKVTSFFAEVPNGKLVDVGAGLGNLANRIYSMGGFDVYACDARMPPEHNRGDLKVVLPHSHLKWSKLDLDKDALPYASNFFEYAICIDVIEHLENPRRVLSEIGRVLKPGGMAIIATPYLGSLPQRIYYFFTGRFLHFPEFPPLYAHITPLTMTTMRDAFKKAGLVIEKISFDRGWLPFLRLTLPANSLWGDSILLQVRKQK